MADSISWLDSIGPATLSNGKPDPATRFGNWTPDVEPIGPSVVGLGTGRTHRFEFRRDDVVSFEIAAIPQTAANLTLAKRLKYHLMNGGFVSLTTDRPLADEFFGWCLAPESVPVMTDLDRSFLEFTFAVKLKGLTETEVGSGDFIPSFEPDLVFWHEARFMEPNYDDQQYVGRLVDYSPSAAHADQPTGASQGWLKKNIIDGHAVIETATPQGNYVSPVIFNPVTAGMTMFYIMRATTYRYTGTFVQLSSNPSQPADADHRIQDFREDGYEFIGYNLATGAGVPVGVNNGRITEPPDAWCIGELTMTAGRLITPYQNGVAGATFTPPSTLDRDTRLTLLTGGNSGTITGQLAALLIWRGVLSSTPRTRIRNYLAANFPSAML